MTYMTSRQIPQITSSSLSSDGSSCSRKFTGAEARDLSMGRLPLPINASRSIKAFSHLSTRSFSSSFSLQQPVLQAQDAEVEMSEAEVVSIEAEAEAVEAVSVEQLDVTMNEVGFEDDGDDDDQKMGKSDKRRPWASERSLEKRQENILGEGVDGGVWDKLCWG
jgi:hypothetical protein